ncbi:hypothetical protein [Escherichia coli]|uniref:hypothetical protein n=1 Tax=Escherichia coli TaxID=562 RepID=UPI0002A3394F|nr:hypothetical protein [Escherichia coli]ELF96791.1 hypothetical protein A1S5_04022 [Escherichia coli KTE48]
MSTVYYPCGIRRIVAVLLVILSASAIAAKNVKHADMTVSVDIPIPTCSVNINNKSNDETFSEIPEQIKTGCHITRHKTRRF